MWTKIARIFKYIWKYHALTLFNLGVYVLLFCVLGELTWFQCILAGFFVGVGFGMGLVRHLSDNHSDALSDIIDGYREIVRFQGHRISYLDAKARDMERDFIHRSSPFHPPAPKPTKEEIEKIIKCPQGEKNGN
jgi:hypothetical protein